MGKAGFFHAPHGGAEFLGKRPSRSGGTEVVYDDGVARRMVSRVEGKGNDQRISDALQVAVRSLRVVPTLYDEMQKRAISIERVAG